MGKFWRIARSVLVGLITILAAGVALAYAVSERALRRIYPTPSDAVAIPSDSAAVERGRHIVHAIGTCTTCHGDDLGGAVYADMGPIGVVAGPNLTRAPSGRGSQFDNADWIRAIRYGPRRDGRSLIAMPSEVFTNLSDADLGAVVAYLKQVSPVDRTVPTSRFGLVGRALLAAGKLSVLTAPKTHHGEPLWSGSIPYSASREYGHYLVEIAGCAGCHVTVYPEAWSLDLLDFRRRQTSRRPGSRVGRRPTSPRCSARESSTTVHRSTRSCLGRPLRE